MTEKQNPEEKSVPFFPDHALYEAKVAMWFGVGLIILGIYALFNHLGLGDPADPMVTPVHTKPEWYFLALFYILKFLSKTLGAVLPVLLVLVILVWPFLDSKPDKSRQTTRNRLIITGVLVVVITVLSILGEVT